MPASLARGLAMRVALLGVRRTDVRIATTHLHFGRLEEYHYILPVTFDRAVPIAPVDSLEKRQTP